MYERHAIDAAGGPASAAPPSHEDDGLPPRRRALALAAIYAGFVLVVVDGAVVNVALPTIGETLKVGSAASVAVATSYQLAVVISMLPLAALGESLGPRRVFVAGATLFILASCVCAASPNLSFLIAGRFLQGIGGGAIMSLASMLLRFSMPKDRLASAIGWNAVVVALASAAGPSIGALILSVASWPWLFAVNLPIGLLGLAMSRALPAVAGSGHRVDAISALASAGLFTLFFVGAGRIVENPALGVGLIVAASLCLIGLIRRERGRAAPLVPIDLFVESTFRRTVLASGATFCAQMMSTIALPFHLQRALGADVLSTGLYMSAWPIAIVLSASSAGRLAGRMSGSKITAIGTSVLAFALLLAGLIPTSSGVASLVGLMAVAGFGFGIFQPANNRLLLLSAPKARSGAAGGVQGTTRLVGQTFGATVMTALFQLAPGDTAPRLGLIVAAAFALTGAAIGASNAARGAREM